LGSESHDKVLLPLLKGLYVTRDILRNNEITLNACGMRNTILYSADLSKATDPISVELSRFVLDEITKHTGKPEWWDDALDGVINTHEISTPDGDEFTSRCGALMGLGPGWAVLCILNAFCAFRAGAPKRSFAVCGDDLIGLWPRELVDSYEDNLELLGLKANKTKSFRSEVSGVFCERFVTKLHPQIARSQAVLRLGEATAARARSNRSELTVLDNLLRKTQGQPLRRLARRAAQKSLPTQWIPGALADGGAGLGSADMTTLLSYILRGPINLTARIPSDKDEAEMRDLREQLRLLRPTAGARVVAASDVLVEALRVQNTRYVVAKAATKEAPRRKTYHELQRELNTRYREVKKIFHASNGEPLKALDLAMDKRTYVFQRPRLLCGLRRLIRHKRYDLALGLAKKSWDVHVAQEDARNLVHSAIRSSKTVIGQRQNLNLASLGGWCSEPSAVA
jgi:hypothetical protein